MTTLKRSSKSRTKPEEGNDPPNAEQKAEAGSWSQNNRKHSAPHSGLIKSPQRCQCPEDTGSLLCSCHHPQLKVMLCRQVPFLGLWALSAPFRRSSYARGQRRQQLSAPVAALSWFGCYTEVKKGCGSTREQSNELICVASGLFFYEIDLWNHQNSL